MPKQRAAPETVERISEYLREHADRYRNGDGFTGTSLYRDMHADGHQIGAATVSTAMHQLREQEVVRLVRRGTGGSRVYRLA
jgi:Fe2+ or Zn2+ uptake regulation protein